MTNSVLTKSLEDYLESIYLEKLENDRVRLKNISKRLGVSAPSALQAVRNLEETGFVRHEKYCSITLTESGEKRAREIYQKHRALFEFLHNILGLPREISQSEACSLEHHMSDETMDRFVRFINYLKRCPAKGGTDFSHFHRYYESLMKNEYQEPENTTLASLEDGAKGIFVSITGSRLERAKLIEAGILPGLHFSILKKTGKTIILAVNGNQTEISLKESSLIVAKAVGECEPILTT